MDRLESSLQNKRQSQQAQGTSSDTIILDKGIKPSAIRNISEDMAACASDEFRHVYLIPVHSNGHFLCGTITTLCAYPNGCQSVNSTCLLQLSIHGTQQWPLKVSLRRRCDEQCFSYEWRRRMQQNSLCCLNGRWWHSLYRRVEKTGETITEKWRCHCISRHRRRKQQ